MGEAVRDQRIELGALAPAPCCRCAAEVPSSRSAARAEIEEMTLADRLLAITDNWLITRDEQAVKIGRAHV